VIRTSQILGRLSRASRRFWDRGLELHGDELDVLVALVSDFERRHHTIEFLYAVEAVTGLMDRLQPSRQDLLPIFGTAGKLSEFLSGKRSLSKAQIKALHRRYRIPYESLMG
jgi:HTH-type transcriptional regulator/antitoxin HigA